MTSGAPMPVNWPYECPLLAKADTGCQIKPRLLQVIAPEVCYLYATFGAVPSRPSGFALELIIALVLWRPFDKLRTGLGGLIIILAFLRVLCVEAFPGGLGGSINYCCFPSCP